MTKWAMRLFESNKTGGLYDYFFIVWGFFLLFGISACENRKETLQFPQTLRDTTLSTADYTRDNYDVKTPIASTSTNPTNNVNNNNTTQQIQTPQIEVIPEMLKPIEDIPTELNRRKEIVFSAENMPLPEFINEVFVNILKFEVEWDDSLKKAKPVITLRIPHKVSPQALYAQAQVVLNEHGIVLKRQQKRLNLTFDPKNAEGPPLLISGRTLPDVPGSHRTIFQYVPLKVINQGEVRNWIQKAYEGLGLKVESQPFRNGLILIGPQKIVKQAYNAIKLFDKPAFKGRQSARFELKYQTPENIQKSLNSILKTEGYSIATADGLNGSVTILPLKYLDSILIFTVDQQTLQHIAKWIKTLDRTPRQTKNKSTVHYYEVRNTRADTLVGVLNQLFSSGSILPTQTALPNQKQGTGADIPTPSKKTAAPSGQRIVLDETRNAIIFQGNAEEWASVRDVLQKMDKPAKQVLAEVTIAEITLTDEENFGIEWLVRASLPGLNGFLGTLGGLNLAGGGLSYTLDSAGQTRAILNAMASNQRVSILSTPRLLVKSGEEASIDVGSEVPIVTSETNSTTQTNGNSNVLRQVQYRKTGVLLQVTPVIHSRNRVDLKISQEVSEAQTNTTSSISSPSIFTRKVDTSVTLKDGGSVMLAGLITRSSNTGERGVPILKDIPVVGGLFQGQQY